MSLLKLLSEQHVLFKLAMGFLGKHAAIHLKKSLSHPFSYLPGIAQLSVHNWAINIWDTSSHLSLWSLPSSPKGSTFCLKAQRWAQSHCTNSIGLGVRELPFFLGLLFTEYLLCAMPYAKPQETMINSIPADGRHWYLPTQYRFYPSALLTKPWLYYERPVKQIYLPLSLPLQASI